MLCTREGSTNICRFTTESNRWDSALLIHPPFLSAKPTPSVECSGAGVFLRQRHQLWPCAGFVLPQRLFAKGCDMLWHVGWFATPFERQLSVTTSINLPD